MHTNAIKRKRTFLLVLPMIVFPFLILLYWLFGGGEGMLPGASSPMDDYYLQQGMNAMDIGQQSKKMCRGIDIAEQINSRNIGIDSQNPVNIDNMTPSQYTNDKAREAILRARNKLTYLF